MTSTATNGSGDKGGLLSSGAGVEEESNQVGSSFSLVRYNNPVLIDKHQETPTPPSSSKLIKKIYTNYTGWILAIVPSGA